MPWLVLVDSLCSGTPFPPASSRGRAEALRAQLQKHLKPGISVQHSDFHKKPLVLESLICKVHNHNNSTFYDFSFF